MFNIKKCLEPAETEEKPYIILGSCKWVFLLFSIWKFGFDVQIPAAFFFLLLAIFFSLEQNRVKPTPKVSK